MAAWLTIYCKRPLIDIPEQLQKCVDVADWWTMLEEYGIDDEAIVDAALAHFRIETMNRPLGEAYRVPYRPAGQRQLDIERWAAPGLVAEELAEASEGITKLRSTGAKAVRAHLSRVKETIAIDLGWGQLEGMAIVFAVEIARWLAHVGKGVVKDHEEHWWGVTRGGQYKLLVSRGRKRP